MEVHDNDRANVNATFVSHVFNCRYSSSANKVQFVDDCNGSIVNLIPSISGNEEFEIFDIARIKTIALWHYDEWHGESLEWL